MVTNLSLNLMRAGIVLTSFYEILIRLFPGAFVKMQDTREPKEGVALFLVAGLSLLTAWLGKFKKPLNKWPFVFGFFILVSIRLMPDISMTVNGVPTPSPWVWKFAFIYWAYLFFWLAVQSIGFSDHQRDGILKTCFWCGFLMAVYSLLQFLSLEQFYELKTAERFLHVDSRNVVGTLGQPTILAPYISMLIPIAFYFRKWWHAGVMGIAVAVTQSQVSLAALILSCGFYFLIRCPRRAIPVFILVIVLGLLTFRLDGLNHNGRVEVWRDLINDVRTDNQAITGIGPEGFKYVHHAKHNTNFFQAHNEYLEVLRNFGIIGLGIFFMGLFRFCFDVKKILSSRFGLCAATSLMCVSLCAIGTFPFQIAPILIITVTICGLVYNEINKGVVA